MRRLSTSLLCAAALLVGAVACSDDDDSSSSEESSTTTSTTTAPPDEPTDMMSVDPDDELALGAYFIDPDDDAATPLTVTYDIADEGWGPWMGAVKRTDGEHVNMNITTVTNVVTDGCLDHSPADPTVGPTVDDLATALSALSPFEATSPPTDVTILGYEGKHLVVTVPDGPFTECEEEQQLHSWIAPFLGGSYHGYNGPEPGLTEEFWILDVDGTRLVLEFNTSPDAPADAVAERQAIFDSIQIEA